jgi:CBS-domain-containing membrane protein
MRPTTGGRHTAVCLQPSGVLNDWQQHLTNLPVSTVQRYMTGDVVTARPQTELAELVRTMIDAHIHRVVVVDEQCRPVGIVSSTDILAALAYSDSRS